MVILVFLTLRRFPVRIGTVAPLSVDEVLKAAFPPAAKLDRTRFRLKNVHSDVPLAQAETERGRRIATASRKGAAKKRLPTSRRAQVVETKPAAQKSPYHTKLFPTRPRLTEQILPGGCPQFTGLFLANAPQQTEPDPELAHRQWRGRRARKAQTSRMQIGLTSLQALEEFLQLVFHRPRRGLRQSKNQTELS